MDNRRKDLSDYRLSQAEDSLKVAKMCYREEILRMLLIAHIMQRLFDKGCIGFGRSGF